jgi:hypothetical protein
MMTNAPDHSLPARSFLPAEIGIHPMGAIEWFLRKLQSAVCSLHGHDSILQYERTRIFLRCTSCGYETPGWEVSPRPPGARRRPDLSFVRKIA